MRQSPSSAGIVSTTNARRPCTRDQRRESAIPYARAQLAQLRQSRQGAGYETRELRLTRKPPPRSQRLCSRFTTAAAARRSPRFADSSSLRTAAVIAAPANAAQVAFDDAPRVDGRPATLRGRPREQSHSAAPL